MITDDDRRILGDLAMRALDVIADEYGDEADLITATLVFEVRAPDPDDDGFMWHGHYESLGGTSPHHTAGLLASTADHIMRQEA